MSPYEKLVYLIGALNAVGFLVVWYARRTRKPQKALDYNTELNGVAPEYPFWLCPKGRPYEICGGPLSPDPNKRVWTSERKVEGYKLVEDYYSDRLYHVVRK